MNYEAAKRLLDACGLPTTNLTPEAFDRVTRYFSLRDNWSATHNVAGPRAMESPWELDLPDAIAANQALCDTRPIADVGTGSGTPGLLIACLRPNHTVYLIEPIAKRTAFLRTATATLTLKNVRTLRGRWPQEIDEESLQVISRAVVSPEVWPQLANQRAPAADHILRMLAANRPPLDIPGYQLAASVEYDLHEHGGRLVERWEPSCPHSA